MRILLVITNLDTGGAQRQLVNLAVGLKAKGHHVEFWTYYPEDFFAPLLREASIELSISLKASRFSSGPIGCLRKKVIDGNFNTVLAFLETPSIYAELACVGLRNVRLYVSERNGSKSDRINLGQFVKSLLHLFSTGVIANSHARTRWLGNRCPWLKSRLITIWNGVNTDLFLPVEGRTRGDVLRLIGVGRITPQKNLLALIRAMGICKRSGIRFVVEWAGKTDMVSYYHKVLKALNAESLGDSWVWLGEQREVPALLRKCDALILPSLWEGLPNVICEGLASGLPILAGDVADNRLLVGDGERGFLFDPDDPESMAAAITRMAGLDLEEYRKLCRSAREFAVMELSQDACLVQYEAVLAGGCKIVATNEECNSKQRNLC